MREEFFAINVIRVKKWFSKIKQNAPSRSRLISLFIHIFFLLPSPPIVMAYIFVRFIFFRSRGFLMTFHIFFRRCVRIGLIKASWLWLRLSDHNIYMHKLWWIRMLIKLLMWESEKCFYDGAQLLSRDVAWMLHSNSRFRNATLMFDGRKISSNSSTDIFYNKCSEIVVASAALSITYSHGAILALEPTTVFVRSMRAIKSARRQNIYTERKRNEIVSVRSLHKIFTHKIFGKLTCSTLNYPKKHFFSRFYRLINAFS